MVPCVHCREQLLDYLYGLFDEDESRPLEEHIASCPECKEALDLAQRQQKLLGRAAHVVREVTPFALPGKVAAERPAALKEPVIAASANAPAAATVSLPKHTILRRLWPAWAVAAGLLVAAVGLQQMYQGGLAEHDRAVVLARRDLQKIDDSVIALKRQQLEDGAKAEADLRRSVLHVAALGPTVYHAAVPAECRVTTRDLDGALTKAEIRMEIVDPASGDVFYHKKAQSDGELALSIPAGLDLKGPAKIIVEAKTAKSREKIEETLTPATRTYATHLALNKSTYQAGEVLFFRTVTLDRVSHQPPAESVPLRVALVNEAGAPVLQMAAATGPGGISAGNFAITDELEGGVYTLQVRAEDKAKDYVVGHALPLEVVRDAVEVEFDRANYKAGEPVTVYAWRRNQGKSTKVKEGREGREGKDGKEGEKTTSTYGGYGVRIVVDGKPVPALNAGAYSSDFSQTLTADAYGNAVVKFKLPAHIERGEAYVELEKKVGDKAERQVYPVPVLPSDVTVDFYPEGGRLVNGVENTVYYRVRTASGAAFDPDGRLVVSSTKGEIYKSDPKQGWGSFSFTPDPKEKYTAHIPTALPGKEKVDIVEPFAELLSDDGVALHVEKPVAAAGEPIEVALRNGGKPKTVLLVGACRGVVFDQQVLSLKTGDNSATLKTPPRVDGLLRVTLLEAPTNAGIKKVRPLAERLVFRKSVEKLNVTCTFDRKNPRAGDDVKIDINVQDEKGKETSTWFLATAVDERVRSPFSETNLKAFFHVASDVASGADLDQAAIMLDDARGKEAEVALDLFLSVHGYRRFTTALASETLARAEGADPRRVDKTDPSDKDKSGDKKASETPEKTAKKSGDPAVDEAKAGELKLREKKAAVAAFTVAIFSRESQSLFDQRAAFREELETTIKAQVSKAEAKRREAQEARGLALESARLALEEKANYEARPVLYGRMALSILFIILLSLGLAADVVGFYRWARAKSPRLAFGFGILCQACGFGVYICRQEVEVRQGERQVAWLVNLQYEPFVEPRLALTFAKTPARVVGPIALAKETFESLQPGDVDAPTVVTLKRSVSRDDVAPTTPPQKKPQAQEQAAKRLALLRAFDHQAVPLEPLLLNEEMASRFKAASEVQRRGDKGADADMTVVRLPGKDDAKQKDEAKKDTEKGEAKEENEATSLLVREYAYRPFALRPDFQDTVLWHPALFAENGKASVSFGLSPGVPAYRVLLLGNSADGRLGLWERRLEVETGEAAKK